MPNVYQSGNMIVVRKPTANGDEVTGYAISQYDYVKLTDGRIRIVRKADGLTMTEV